jgi:hypothetical protein
MMSLPMTCPVVENLAHQVVSTIPTGKIEWINADGPSRDNKGRTLHAKNSLWTAFLN